MSENQTPSTIFRDLDALSARISAIERAISSIVITTSTNGSVDLSGLFPNINVIGHSSLPDTRAVATVPNDYFAKIKWQFKQCATLGVPGGTYAGILGLRSWSDATGDLAHELAFSDNGHVYHRSGSTTTWGAWSLMI